MRSRRQLLAAAAGLAMSSTMPSRRVVAAAPGPISPVPPVQISSKGRLRIAVILPYSGGIEVVGRQARAGVDLAIGQINQRGGIDGRLIEAVHFDSKNELGVTMAVAEQIGNEGRYCAVLGPLRSHLRAAIQPIFSSQRIPLLYGANYEGNGCERYFFSFNSVPNQEIRQLVPAMVARGRRRHFLIGGDTVWPITTLAIARRVVTELGCDVVGEAQVPNGAQDFSTLIARIVQSGADSILLALPGVDGIRFLAQAYREDALKQRSLGLFGFNDAYLAPLAEASDVDVWAVVSFAAVSMEEPVQNFVRQALRVAGGSVGITQYLLAHYNMANAFARALERSRQFDGDGVVEGLEGLSLQTPTGPLLVRRDNHHVTMNLYLINGDGRERRVVEKLEAIDPEIDCALHRAPAA